MSMFLWSMLVKVLWDWIGGRMGEIPYCLAGGEVEADVEDLNHTSPEPSKSTAAPGALAMYLENVKLCSLVEGWRLRTLKVVHCGRPLHPQ
jgi:hypothetical protein